MAVGPKKSLALDTTVIEGVAIIAFCFRALTAGDGEGQYLSFVQVAELHGSKFSQ